MSSRGQTHFSRERDCIVFLPYLIGVMTFFNVMATDNTQTTISNEIDVIDARIDDEWQTFEATAYTAECKGCIGITKSGYDVRETIYSPNGHRVIAVDPTVIPLHSLVEIRLSDDTVFTARALDIGGAIKGNRIDLLMGEYGNAMKFGRRDVELKIIEKGAVE